MEQKAKGHILALITIFIWGTTFISTKFYLKLLRQLKYYSIDFYWGSYF